MSAAAQRGLRRPGLLQPHRVGARPTPTRRSRQVPHEREDWIPIDCPRVVSDELFQTAGQVSTENVSGARAEPSPAGGCSRAWSSAVSAGSAPTATRCAAATAGWHFYYYCRNHDPLRAGQEDRRCPERNIRAEALDAFVFDQLRAALTQPDLLLAGERAVNLHTPIPNDELLARRTDELDRKIDATERSAVAWSTSTRAR